ncbi:MAG: nucleoside deaminase [Cytophagales bacterium]
MEKTKFIDRAIGLSAFGSENSKGGPFGCVVVKNGEIVGEGYNEVSSSHDPTAHAEIVAIRNACKNLQTFQLDGCEIYTSCEPCPMCFGAIYWARPTAVYYANTRKDAAKIGFDDEFIYKELNVGFSERKIPFYALERNEALKVFEKWSKMEHRIDY